MVAENPPRVMATSVSQGIGRGAWTRLRSCRVMAPDPVRHKVMIDGRQIDTVTLGGDESLAPIVMLHEGLGSVGLWRHFPTTLNQATGRRVIAFSRFGHGHSERTPWPRDVTGFHHREALEMLPELFAALGLSEPLLVGHSDGASIALIYASRRPVSGLVLLAPHVCVEDLGLDAIRATRTSYEVGDLRERMLKHHDDPDAAFWGWCDMWLDPAFRTWDLGAEIRRVEAPMLLIQGSEDPYGTLAHVDRIAAGTRGPFTRMVLSGGHSPHQEHAGAVVRAVAKFASSRS
jgi:pimeloyl-ACP methyl ester carboxylesterase